MSFLNALKSLLSGAGLLTPILAMFGITIPPVALAVIPLVTTLMGKAEEALGDGTGALKKEAVTAAVVGFTDVMKTASTGGQAETWKEITPDMVSGLIDTVATVANNISKGTGGEAVFDDTQFELNKSQTF
jgi:hypothetical protein